MKSLHREGKSREKIEEELGVEIKKTAFFSNIKKDFAQTSSRSYNHTHTRTDNQFYKKFKLDVVQYFNKKTAMVFLGFDFSR